MLAAVVMSGGAEAAVITFETAPLIPNFVGPVTESGFTYSGASGALVVNNTGNPGQDMEGEATGGGGVLKIVSAGAPKFTFESVDFAAFADSGTGSQTLSVTGLLGGAPVATDTWTLANANTIPYSWTTEGASNLQGKAIDELLITLDGSPPAAPVFYEAVDNVTLSGVGVPETTTWAMMLIGLFGLGAMTRSRSRTAPAT
jgi:hypothetical protein